MDLSKFVNQLNTRMILYFGVISVTSSSFIIKFAKQDPYSLAFVRVLWTGFISFFFLQPTFKITSKNEPLNIKSISLILLAGLSLATHFAWWFASLNYIPIGISLSLTNTAPVFITLFSIIIYKIFPTFKQKLAVIFVILGSIILFSSNSDLGSNSILGLTLALLSALGFALYLICAKELVEKVGMWKYFGLVNLSASLFLVIWLLINHQISNLVKTNIWFWGLLLAIFPGLLGHAIYNWSMSKLDAIDVGIATLGEPILGTILAFFIFTETLDFYQIIGFSFLLIAIALTIEFKRKNIINLVE